ncbi:MAG: class I SAM-dependent DNA methyltransferase, partial [Kiritimatiellae bacterium]|nr:class I SAM-dependent DNA methyltransferase [Kiritimatiellia bacterium]
KVIGPLFLDRLQAELSDIKAEPTAKARDARLRAFVDKLASLTFLDPACGSGNFLTETYVCLRRLENRIIAALQGGQGQFDLEGDTVKVSIRQFHGIEINDFAVAVAKSALWIAESQMLNETQALLHRNIDFLPLKTYDGIVEGNALRMDWSSLAPRFDYIMGNPPFAGAMKMKGEKRNDVEAVFPECPKVGEIDYVAGWYAKAAKLIRGTSTRCAFVSTNSISQGQQVSLVWKPLFERLGIHIDFAYRTFRWDSESNKKAAVHCVIVGFSSNPEPDSPKLLFLDELRHIEARHINGYLLEGDDVCVDGFKLPLCGQPPMHMGVMARDGGFLIMSDEERLEYEAREPRGMQFVRRYLMGKEFINKIDRWCFWLLGADPSEIKKCPLLLERIENVRKSRLESPAAETRKLADTPTLFAQLAQPKKPFLAVPSVSSEQRRYVPIGFLTPDIIVGNKLYVVEDVAPYHFGILTSNVHNAWMRTVCGRLEMRYNYSNTIVYNTFPWPQPTDEQKQRIEKSAQSILDTRANYPNASLADLYDERTMPPDLRKAHQENDRAVMAAYGFPVKTTESECVAELFKRYQSLVAATEKGKTK